MTIPPAHPTALLREFRAAHPLRHLPVPDGSWPYVAAGVGGGAVLLLPGAFVGAEMWFYMISALRDRCRLLAPDMPSRTLSLAETLAALARLLEVEGVERAIVVGYSAGGGLAQAFAQAHPQRVAGLVLSHCTPLSPETARRVRRVASLARLLPPAVLRAIFTARTSRHPAASAWAAFTRAFFGERIARLEKAALLRFLEAGAEAAEAFRFDPEALQGWAGRILLLTSRDDATTFPRLGELQARYPAAQVQVFEQGGHHTVLLFPEAYLAALESFITDEVLDRQVSGVLA